ncbi:IS4 family transposase [Umezawaea sp. Da 62-37]|uniref:IS4 family transposase n=1 Tax=Umezawaea sp. Da 62-37 TaxID=3075927 RepID=UPI0028F720EC|nr:IS4 family transposase [Umezawaea sp. Da 62-37]WNV87642.1 IS4 family transposase [Umezawaea sp. Da 62-37]WNV91009.1 IS4 family transposase [Umezawaea sp. Da 62-37]WNV91487.1 IS4 family transposase [Umezawaea sp. Da 62-37]
MVVSGAGTVCGVDAGVVSPDQVSLGVLVAAVSRDAVDDAVAVCGVGAKRSDGKLPPHVVAYLTMALCLFPEDDYTEVATRVTGSLDRWGCWNADWAVPTASAITQARKRLGRGVFPEIFERTCGPVAGDASPVAGAIATGRGRGSWLRGWRVLAIDGFDVDVPDTPGNAAEFGYGGPTGKRSAFPKARVVAVAECGTHAFVAAEVGAYAVGEKTLAGRLYPRLRREELLTADRNFYGFRAWGLAAGTGAALLWRAPTQLRLPVVRVLPDGTYLSVVVDPALRGGRRERVIAAAVAGEELDPREGHLVRVVEYDVPDRLGNGEGELIVLLTTITDPAHARADELAAAYHQRWEQETANDQLKTHLRGPGRVLRSRLPDLVHQEIWAWLIVHHAITALMARAAEAADLDPDRLSYTGVLRLVRRSATGTADISP